MQEDLNLPPELQQLEGRLAALRPAAAGASPAELMYLAGRASAGGPRRARNWLWPAVTVAACCIAAVAVGFVALAPPAGAPRIVYVDRTVAAPPIADALGISQIAADEPAVPAAGAWSPNYLALRSAIVAEGLDALPAPRRGVRPAAAPPQYDRVSDSLLAFQTGQDAAAEPRWSWLRLISPFLEEMNP